MDIHSFLENLRIYGEMPEKDKAHLMTIVTIKEYDANKTLLKAGNYCSKIWFLLSGSIRMFHIQNKKESTLHMFYKPRFFTDLISLSEQKPAIISVLMPTSGTIERIISIRFK